jgi:hypothetical protein
MLHDFKENRPEFITFHTYFFIAKPKDVDGILEGQKFHT